MRITLNIPIFNFSFQLSQLKFYPSKMVDPLLKAYVLKNIWNIWELIGNLFVIG